VFTVRVEERKDAKISECRQYTVHRVDGRVILTLYAEPGPLETQVPLATVALEGGMRAFVMNDNGKTVDVLRGERA
jgi:hypothetical protein